MQVRIATGISCALLEAIVRWINAPKRLKLNFHGLTHETQLLLCLKKLRHNACDALLAADFQVTILTLTCTRNLVHTQRSTIIQLLK